MKDAVTGMLGALHHRGPDDEGMVIAEGAALGARRLSIIDLAGGHQPILSEDGAVVVVCNGEIYNFEELRRELQARGHTFRTRSDTEVIVHAYECWGIECVARLRGMFAFAVHDRRGPGRGRLLLVRDRLGIKPLYYYRAGGLFLFASEVRALLASGAVPRRLCAAAVESYLLFGSVSEPMTLVDGVVSLPPGHRLLVPLDEDWPAGRPEPYWIVPRPPLPSPDGDRRVGDAMNAVEEVRARVEESVRLHLIADVPIGIFLSSGIDSTVVAAVARRQRAELHSFTVAFPDEGFSEAAMARRTAAALGTTHHEVTLTGDEVLTRLDNAVAAFDQPSMDGVNTYFVSSAAHAAGFKVALSGLGGDEVFGGYPTFRWTGPLTRLARLAAHVPAPVRSALSPALGAAGIWFGRGDAAAKLDSLIREPDALPHPYFFARTLFTPRQVRTLLDGTDDPRASLWWSWLAAAAAAADDLDDFSRVSWLESQSYLVGTLLRDTDAVSMAHSLEVRVPFLDHELVGLVGRLTPAAKLGRGPKGLLVEAFADVLPREVVRQKKRTFSLPWDRWLRTSLRDRMDDDVSACSLGLRDVLDPASVSRVWTSFLSGRTGWARPWALYVLAAWVRRHLGTS